MAAFELPFGRRKVNTYGKATRKPQSTLWSLDASPEKPKFVNFATPSESSLASPPSEENQKPGKGKLIAPSPRKSQKDTLFDVPLSDDDSPQSPKVLKPKPQNKLVKPGRAVKVGSDPEDRGNTSRSDTDNPKKRKRVAVAQRAEATNMDDVMEQIQAELRESYKGSNVDKIDTNGTTGKVHSVAVTATPPPAAKKPRQRKHVAASPKAKKNLAKGASAPAPLRSMVSEPDTDSARSPAPSAATPEPPMGVDSLPTTPPSKIIDSPTSGIGSGAVTPRQREMWSKLLVPSDPPISPGQLPMSKLGLASGRKPPGLPNARSEGIQVGRYGRRGRLVDMLREAAPDEEQEEDGVDSEQSPTTPAERSAEPNAHRLAPPPPPRELSGTDIYSKNSTKVTYAQQRSYLEDRTEAEAFEMLMEERDIMATAKPSQSQPSGIEEDDEEEESQGANPRSVHDLRAAGARRRLLHDLEALVNEVGGQGFDSLSAKRSALVELTIKLYDKEALACCIENGLDHQILANCAKTDDPWFNFAMTTAMGLLINGGAGMGFLVAFHKSKCFKHMDVVMGRNLGDIKELVKSRKENLSKITRSTFLDLRAKIEESDIWSSGKPLRISPRLMAVKTVELFVRRLRELGSQDIILGQWWVIGVVAVAESGLLDYLEGRNNAPDVQIPLAALSALESDALVPPSKSKDLGWAENVLSHVVRILNKLFEPHAVFPASLEMLVIRLTLNLTNNNPIACAPFANPDIVQGLLKMVIARFRLLSTEVPKGEHRLMHLDWLIIALGVLINLAEWSDEARLSVMDGSEDVLNDTVRFFIKGRERASEAESIQASQTNVAYGYLAVFLGNICQNERVRRAVESKLPNGSLEPLLEAVEEFILFNQKVDKEAFESEEGNEVFEQFTERLRAVVDRLRRDI